MTDPDLHAQVEQLLARMDAGEYYAEEFVNEATTLLRALLNQRTIAGKAMVLYEEAVNYQGDKADAAESALATAAQREEEAEERGFEAGYLFTSLHSNPQLAYAAYQESRTRPEEHQPPCPNCGCEERTGAGYLLCECPARPEEPQP